MANDNLSTTSLSKKATISTLEALVYTPKELEVLLGLSKNSVNALLNSGKLRSIRYGRKWLIPHSSLDDFLK